MAYLYCFTVHFGDNLLHTNECTVMHTNPLFEIANITSTSQPAQQPVDLIHARDTTYTHTQGKHTKYLIWTFNYYDILITRYINMCFINYLQICCRITETYNKVINFLTYNFNNEHCILPEDDLRIETCRRVLNVLV